MMGRQRVACPSPQSNGLIKILDAATKKKFYFYKSKQNKEKPFKEMNINSNLRKGIPMKKRTGQGSGLLVLVVVLLGITFFFAGCAAQRCDCTDLSKRYTPPKQVHRLQRH